MSVLFVAIVQYVKSHQSDMRIFFEDEKALVYKEKSRGRMLVVQAQEKGVLVNKVAFDSWDEWFAFFGLMTFARFYAMAQDPEKQILVRHYDAENQVLDCIVKDWEGNDKRVRVKESRNGFLLDRCAVRHKTFASWKASLDE